MGSGRKHGIFLSEFSHPRAVNLARLNAIGHENGLYGLQQGNQDDDPAARLEHVVSGWPNKTTAPPKPIHRKYQALWAKGTLEISFANVMTDEGTYRNWPARYVELRRSVQ